MKIDGIINALNNLEMKGGMNLISEEFRAELIAVLQPKKTVKRSPKPSTDAEVPTVKGKAPE